MKTVFMGNHTVGVIVLGKLVEQTDVLAVFAHPDHPDDGTLYLSVKEFAKNRQIPVFQLTGQQNERIGEILNEIAPDLIVVADYKYLLKKEVIKIPKLGIINFHPSLLPKYRGRAPVNWAIINGEKKCGLTVHYVDEGMDTGDIILQEEVDIIFEDTIKDVHDKLFPLYVSLTERVIELFKKGIPPKHKQDHSKATAFPKRRPEDGLIDWSAKTIDIYNLIRAVTYPYPGAFSFIENEKYMIWSSCPENNKTNLNLQESLPGQICSIDNSGIIVRTNDGFIRLTEVKKEKNSTINPLTIGQKFVLQKTVH